MIERHLKEVHLTGQLGNKLVYLLVLDYIYDIIQRKLILTSVFCHYVNFDDTYFLKA